MEHPDHTHVIGQCRAWIRNRLSIQIKHTSLVSAGHGSGTGRASRSHTHHWSVQGMDQEQVEHPDHTHVIGQCRAWIRNRLSIQITHTSLVSAGHGSRTGRASSSHTRHWSVQGMDQEQVEHPDHTHVIGQCRAWIRNR